MDFGGQTQLQLLVAAQVHHHLEAVLQLMLLISPLTQQLLDIHAWLRLIEHNIGLVSMKLLQILAEHSIISIHGIVLTDVNRIC